MSIHNPFPFRRDWSRDMDLYLADRVDEEDFVGVEADPSVRV